MKVFWTSNELLYFGLAKLHYITFYVSLKQNTLIFIFNADGVEIVQFFRTFRASNKILTESYCKSVNLELEFHKKSVTRGHNLKLLNSRCHYDLRKYSFAVRVVNIWNSLPDSVISANNVSTFKNRLDKFWTNQELIFG